MSAASEANREASDRHDAEAALAAVLSTKGTFDKALTLAVGLDADWDWWPLSAPNFSAHLSGPSLRSAKPVGDEHPLDAAWITDHRRALRLLAEADLDGDEK